MQQGYYEKYVSKKGGLKRRKLRTAKRSERDNRETVKGEDDADRINEIAEYSRKVEKRE